MSVLVVCDIDGVIADCRHRLPLLKEKKYDEFYELVEKDSVISGGRFLLNSFNNSPEDVSLVFLTGRRDSSRKGTINWLRGAGFTTYDAMFMRESSDHRPSKELKPELFGEIIKMYQARGYDFRLIYFIDDDPENVKAVCDKFPEVQGIVFGLERMEKEIKWLQ